MSTKVLSVNISLIKPYWRNPRENTLAIEKVKESIKNYGYNQYIVVDENYIIVAGHTRYKALLELGFTEIPVIVADLDKDKAKEYRIADNKTNEYSEWNFSFLVTELREIKEIDRLQAVFKEDLEKILATSVNSQKAFEKIGGRKSIF